jgi:hypothetical protein
MPEEPLLNRILQDGKQYEPALLPKGVARGKVGKCFDTCLIEALKNPKLRYVEGVAMCYAGKDQLEKLKGTWILHAWLTDGKHAYDPTWLARDGEEKEQPMPAVYVGFEMDTEAVARFVHATEYAGVLANEHRAPALAQKAYGKRTPN